MKNIGFLGFGKIGQAMIKHVIGETDSKVVFAVDNFVTETEMDVELLKEINEEALGKVSLVVECATAMALWDCGLEILKHCDLMVFSIAAFSNQEFADAARKVCEETGHHVFFPHGAILGLDGISDARDLLTEVTIHTVKPPKSFGRTDTERTILFEGTTREACVAYPRNVNVHAAVAMAGIGMDKTMSYVVSDPAYTENCHDIHVKGAGIDFNIIVKSFATGGVTGAYTPVSACGSLDRVLGGKGLFQFV